MLYVLDGDIPFAITNLALPVFVWVNFGVKRSIQSAKIGNFVLLIGLDLGDPFHGQGAQETPPLRARIFVPWLSS